MKITWLGQAGLLFETEGMRIVVDPYLSNSVAVGVYEALRQWDFPSLENQGRLREYDWNE